MGNIVSFTCSLDAIVTRCWDCAATKAATISDLKETRDDLETALRRLKAQRDDLQRQLDVDETQYTKRTAEVDEWLSEVIAAETQVNDLISQVDRELENRGCCGCFPKNLKSRSNLAHDVTTKRRLVGELAEARGKFKNVVNEVPFMQPNVIDCEEMIGLQSTFDKIWELLQDEEVGTIGLQGIGGVGKTALLSQIHNKCLATKDFEVVLWSEVPKGASIVGKVQNDIGKRIGYWEDEWKAQSEEAKKEDIRWILSKRRFVLLLDDLWKPFDQSHLSKIGVPLLSRNNRSKLVFTTRQKEICGALNARKIEVKCLPLQEALDLFNQKVGVDNSFKNHPDYPELSLSITKECDGLPLALVTVGQAMSSKMTYEQWQHALSDLKVSASRLLNMDKVLGRLKYSLDNLRTSAQRECLLYCCLFPQSFAIPKDGIIEYWIGEGLLGANSNYDTDDTPMNCGHRIIDTLSQAYLLLEPTEKEVKMHDLVWEMALWVSKGFGTRNSNVLMEGGQGLTEAPNSSKWKTAKKISLMFNEIENLPEEPLECTNLSSMLLNRNKLQVIPNGFFQHMPSLKVLDLSYNRNLVMLPPDIGNLSSLRYLNLLGTIIMKLPVELKNLTKLEYLNLNYMFKLNEFPSKLVASFKMLHVVKSNTMSADESLIEELNSLKYLSDLHTCLRTKASFQTFQNSKKLLSCISDLSLEGIEGLGSVDMTMLFGTMKHIKKVQIIYCDDLESMHGYSQVFSSVMQIHTLREVIISYCNKLKNLTCLLHCAPNLQVLTVVGCIMLEELTGQDGQVVIESETRKPLSRLEELQLASLPNLKSIYPSKLPFPCLKGISVVNCPNLKKLPLDSTSASSSGCGLVIRGTQRWWNNLEWEDDATKRIFRSSFRETKLMT